MIIDLPKVLGPDLFMRLQAKAKRDNKTIEAALHEVVEWELVRKDANKTIDAVQQLVVFCRDRLDLTTQLGEEYSYRHLPLCLVDAIFSIGVRYTSTRKTVERLCAVVGAHKSSVASSTGGREFTISDLLSLYSQHSLEDITTKVFDNRQRTSATSGILKSEAVLRAAKLMAKFGINSMADAGHIDDPVFEAEFCEIPGQKSGISLRYLRMLVGSENEIKPDRQIIRFIAAATGREPKVDECHPLLVEVCRALSSEYPNLKPRTLDNLIWQYQSRNR